MSAVSDPNWLKPDSGSSVPGDRSKSEWTLQDNFEQNSNYTEMRLSKPEIKGKIENPEKPNNFAYWLTTFVAGQRFESKQLSEQVQDMQLTFLLGEHQLSRQRSHMHRVTLNLYHLTATELILTDLITDIYIYICIPFNIHSTHVIPKTWSGFLPTCHITQVAVWMIGLSLSWISTMDIAHEPQPHPAVSPTPLVCVDLVLWKDDHAENVSMDARNLTAMASVAAKEIQAKISVYVTSGNFKGSASLLGSK